MQLLEDLVFMEFACFLFEINVKFIKIYMWLKYICGYISVRYLFSIPDSRKSELLMIDDTLKIQHPEYTGNKLEKVIVMSFLH